MIFFYVNHEDVIFAINQIRNLLNNVLYFLLYENVKYFQFFIFLLKCMISHQYMVVH